MIAIRQASPLRITQAIGAWFVIASIAFGDGPPAWKTGATLRRQLDERVDGITWQDRPLRDVLASLSKHFGVAVFLDRSVDPDHAISANLNGEPLASVFKQVAASAKAGVALLGSVVYVGPPETATQFAALAAARRQEATPFPAEAKQRLLKQEAWHWDELADPRALLTELSSRAGVTVANPELIPHDLWPAVSLPPLPWTDRMTLLLVGFGLNYQIEDEARLVRLIPIRWPATTANANSPDTLQPSRGATSKKAIEGPKTYSLDVPKGTPAGEVVKTVANRIDKKLTYDATALAKLRQTVSFQVKEVTLDELLTKALSPLGLTYRLTDEALEVFVKDAP